MTTTMTPRERASGKIDTGPLSRENLHQQFCSDWLKDEIERVMNERDQALGECATYKHEFKILQAGALREHAELVAKTAQLAEARKVIEQYVGVAVGPPFKRDTRSRRAPCVDVAAAYLATYPEPRAETTEGT